MFGKEKMKKDLEMYVIHDMKAQHYDNPIFAQSTPVLLRELKNLMKDPKSQDSKYYVNAEDYTLYRHGVS